MPQRSSKKKAPDLSGAFFFLFVAVFFMLRRITALLQPWLLPRCQFDGQSYGGYYYDHDH